MRRVHKTTHFGERGLRLYIFVLFTPNYVGISSSLKNFPKIYLYFSFYSHEIEYSGIYDRLVNYLL